MIQQECYVVLITYLVTHGMCMLFNLQVMQGFTAMEFPHCVGTMDGSHIIIKVPRHGNFCGYYCMQFLLGPWCPHSPHCALFKHFGCHGCWRMDSWKPNIDYWRCYHTTTHLGWSSLLHYDYLHWQTKSSAGMFQPCTCMQDGLQQPK